MAIYGERIEIEFDVVTLSPLHVGSAETPVSTKTIEEGEAEIAPIQKDARGLPLIPGSTLKGALRDIVRRDERYRTAVEDLFGAPLNDAKDGEGPTPPPERSGRPGRVTVFAAPLRSEGKMSKRREAETERRSIAGRDFGYVVAQTAIDGTSGTADANKLFKSEVVAKGAVFRLRIDFAGTLADLDGPAGEALIAALAALTDKDGVPVGRGKGDGNGRLRLADRRESVTPPKVVAIAIEGGQVVVATSISDRSLADDFARRIDEASRTSVRPRRWNIELRSQEPFLVKLEKPKLDKRAEAKGRENVLVAMTDGEGRPELPGSSFMGALRARAKWYLALRRKRGWDTSRYESPARSRNEPTDPIERLFGPEADVVRANRSRNRSYTGWAGLLRLASTTCVSPEPPKKKTFPSVRIDRFSAEPFGGGLFFAEAFVEPAFDVVLEIAPGRGATEQDHRFVEDLLDFLAGDGPGRGIDLGHGVNRGFGWFDVAVVKETNA